MKKKLILDTVGWDQLAKEDQEKRFEDAWEVKLQAHFDKERPVSLKANAHGYCN